MSIATLRAFDFKCIAEPDPAATAAPMTGYLALSHLQVTRHGANTQILEPACASSRCCTQKRKAQDNGFIFVAGFSVVISSIGHVYVLAETHLMVSGLFRFQT